MSDRPAGRPVPPSRARLHVNARTQATGRTTGRAPTVTSPPSGQAGARVADAALPQRSGDRRGEGGELDQGPALAVNHDLVVIETQNNAVFGAGLAAVGLVLDVVDFARRRGLVAAAGLGAAQHWSCGQRCLGCSMR